MSQEEFREVHSSLVNYFSTSVCWKYITQSCSIYPNNSVNTRYDTVSQHFLDFSNTTETIFHCFSVFLCDDGGNVGQLHFNVLAI